MSTALGSEAVAVPPVAQGVDRARLLAFAFARADLLLEIDRAGTITFASGAARWAIGKSAEELVGLKFPSLGAPESKGVLRTVLEAFHDGQRLEPETILFQRGATTIAATIAGCPIPDMPDRYFLSVAHPVKQKAAVIGPTSPQGPAGLLDQESFQTRARQRLDEARERGEELEMTLVDLAELPSFCENLTEETADSFMRGIGLILKQSSVDGDSATQVGDTKFSVLHSQDVVAADIESEITALAERIDPRGSGLTVLAQTLALDAEVLESVDAGRALIYAMNKFAESQPGDFSIASLSSGLKGLLGETMKNVTVFRETLSARGFTLAFQPIVDLLTKEVQHQEALTRLPDGSSPWQMVNFAEDIGLVTELDHAVCRQALELLANDPSICDIAVNISGRSLQSEIFIAALFELLGSHPAERPRVKIEITESSRIVKVDVVANIVRQLQAGRNKVCIDDFGSGAAAFNYLRAFPVDVVKIDGVFVRDIANNPRDATMVRAIGGMCRDLGIQTIAEFVEDERQVSMLLDCRILKGQGYLFGKPGPTPYRTAPAVRMASTVVARRAGSRIEWS